MRRLSIEAELRDGDRIIATVKRAISNAPAGSNQSVSATNIVGSVHTSSETLADPHRYAVSLSDLNGIQLWDMARPQLYTVHVRLLRSGQPMDEDNRRIGFRHAEFTDHGFTLNGKVLKLRGLDRHQTFPFVGQAMPERVQRQDAKILRHKLHCNIVRTSHYPQSRHFLDCCDEIGLLVLEEIPGWQHIGDEAWMQVAVDNVGRMIRRD